MGAGRPAAAAAAAARGPRADGDRHHATLTAAHSAKEQAHGNFKGGFGHHLLLCYLDETGEAPAGILRPGNAGSNTAEDHKRLLDLALAQLDPRALDGEILVCGDGAGATHELCVYCREGSIRFSFGFDLTEPVREAIVGMPESAWVKAIRGNAMSAATRGCARSPTTSSSQAGRRARG
jgi:hypothetical protein